MKRITLIAAIFLSVAAHERNSAAEPPIVEPTPSPVVAEGNTKHKSGGWNLSWEAFIALGTLALALVTVASGYIAWRTEGVFKQIVKTLKQNANVLAQTQARSDEAEVVRTMAACIAQYQELEDKRHEKETKMTADRYFEQLWNLHFAEFHYFKRGFLPPEVYALWICVRHEDYHKPDLKLGKTEDYGWAHAKAYLRDEDFQVFVESWLNKPEKIERSEIMKLIMPLQSSTKPASQV